jgi:L-ascorbate metabolism protein UlaG (beta-lactamase superfamily)
MASELTLTFLGHSAWRITHGDHDILIDPFITGNPSAEKAGIRADDLHPTHIILSHGHGDHLGDTVEIAERSGAQVIAVYELANYLKQQGVKADHVHDMATGGGHDFSFGRVKFTVAHHGSATDDGIYLGPASGILLTIGGTTIYHAGDTALFSDMKLIGARHPIDVAILPIGDNYTMDIDDAVTAVEFLNPKLAIPMHYDTWPPIAADAEMFRSKLEAKGFRGLVLHPGESWMVQGDG